MTTPDALHHSLLRPCILHILRAAGYHSTRPSVLDTLTDLAARYIFLLAQTTAQHASLNHNTPELSLEIDIQDVRMAMQDCGILGPERVLEEQEWDLKQGLEGEDMRGVEGFLGWARGASNREIRRVALEGAEGGKEDYLMVLKKKHATADEDARYTNTFLGKPSEIRAVKVEGGDVTSVKEWVERLQKPVVSTSIQSSRRQSSALSSLDDTMEDMEF
ncbi:related to TAF(II) complex (TBP-associated protein complex) component [Rhynchosporium agropyri]|uniref:Related to TAF(II) complex (TBP-associated protein complex) component n=2 Tax=Rhynchosporium TaxID=38037 RepID=A0A1E1L9G0_9HELO|nr:related to TAF(II) complex (TBP-associated protein complex) component [Rhynchosporium commune]CZT07208.1 related to TAF(II) complex (TBP-associated protein complex) component [Rhynchosporium agropyri]